METEQILDFVLGHNCSICHGGKIIFIQFLFSDTAENNFF